MNIGDLVKKEPSNPLVRSIYADWLEEQGNSDMAEHERKLSRLLLKVAEIEITHEIVQKAKDAYKLYLEYLRVVGSKDPIGVKKSGQPEYDFEHQRLIDRAKGHYRSELKGLSERLNFGFHRRYYKSNHPMDEGTSQFLVRWDIAQDLMIKIVQD